jgi:hypothetical protein
MTWAEITHFFAVGKLLEDEAMPEPLRFKVQRGDEKAWGKLVKSWARGEQAKPGNLTELKQQIRDAGMQEPDCPSFITGLVIIQNDRHILTIRIPPKELIDEGEAAVMADPNAPYPLPALYNDFFRDPPPVGEEKRELHSARVGEYAVNSCQ